MFDAEKCKGDRRLRQISRIHRLTASFRFAYFVPISRLPFYLFFVDTAGSRVHGESFSYSFSSSRILVPIVSPCGIRFWNFHSGRCRTVVSPRIAAGGPVNIASSVIHRHFAILSLRVASSSCMATREWINAATDGGWVWVRADCANLKHDCWTSRPEKIAGFI